MDDYKEITKSYYNKCALEYEEKTKNFVKNYIFNEINLFLQSLTGKKILDLGSGPGRNSLYFKEKGFEPVCIDISEEMIKLCKEKGLNAQTMDIENLEFDDNSFDGIWAYLSLFHLPKNNLVKVLYKIKKIIKEKGIFFVSVKEGDFEGYEGIEHHHYKKPENKKRFSCYYKDLENY